ncbi:hypothetical protein L9F63_021315, partial [Diploptera punctata]
AASVLSTKIQNIVYPILLTLKIIFVVTWTITVLWKWYIAHKITAILFQKRVTLEIRSTKIQGLCFDPREVNLVAIILELIIFFGK